MTKVVSFEEKKKSQSVPVAFVVGTRLVGRVVGLLPGQVRRLDDSFGRAMGRWLTDVESRVDLCEAEEHLKALEERHLPAVIPEFRDVIGDRDRLDGADFDWLMRNVHTRCVTLGIRSPLCPIPNGGK